MSNLNFRELLTNLANNIYIGCNLLELLESSSSALPDPVKCKLSLVHVGLDMACNAIESREIQDIIEPKEDLF
jgi:hypothetical protein